MHARDRAAAGNDAAKQAAVDARYPHRGNHVVMPLIPRNPGAAERDRLCCNARPVHASELRAN